MLLGNAQTETATVSILIALGQPKSTRGRHIKYTHLRRRYILSGVRVPLHAIHTNVRVHSVHGRQIGWRSDRWLMHHFSPDTHATKTQAVQLTRFYCQGAWGSHWVPEANLKTSKSFELNVLISHVYTKKNVLNMYCQVFFVFQHVRPSPSLCPTTYLRWPDSCILHLAWTSKHTTLKNNTCAIGSCTKAAIMRLCSAQRREDTRWWLKFSESGLSNLPFTKGTPEHEGFGGGGAR